MKSRKSSSVLVIIVEPAPEATYFEGSQGDDTEGVEQGEQQSPPPEAIVDTALSVDEPGR